jgi:hypothetical protein
MAKENDIAALEAALATVEEGIRQIEAALAEPGSAGDPGLRSTLADLQGERFNIRTRLANLRAAAVVVAGAPTRGPVGAAPTPGGAPAPAEKARMKATLTFARRAAALAKATLKAAGGGPRPVKKR